MPAVQERQADNNPPLHRQLRCTWNSSEKGHWTPMQLELQDSLASEFDWSWNHQVVCSFREFKSSRYRHQAPYSRSFEVTDVIAWAKQHGNP